MQHDDCNFCDAPRGSQGRDFSGTCGSLECERRADAEIAHLEDVDARGGRFA